jgi:selenocysteine lyase/cysteine desulfurase
MHLKSRGVETRLVPVDGVRLELDRIAAACDARTRVVSVSWVGFASGWRTDLAALCELVHAKGACLFVDAIQGLGAFPLDVSSVPVDFLAADGHKWLLGPEGAGIFYIRRDRFDMLRPLGVGWNSVRHAGDFGNHNLVFKPTAGRYEGGTYNVVGIAALGASLELLLGYGMDRIAGRVLEVTDRLCERLRSAGCQVVSDRTGENRSGIVAVDVPGVSPLEFKRRCRTAGVVVNNREGHVRLSPHAYGSDDDIARLVDIVKRPV